MWSVARAMSTKNTNTTSYRRLDNTAGRRASAQIIRSRAKFLGLGRARPSAASADEEQRPERGQTLRLWQGRRDAYLATTTTRALHEVVDMDFIHGCPINTKVQAVVRDLLLGKKPVTTYPVCVVQGENVCRYEYDEICLGPLFAPAADRARRRLAVFRLPRPGR